MFTVRLSAAECLNELGPAAESAADTLRAALTAENEHLRVDAAAALWAVTGDQVAITALVHLLQHAQNMYVPANVTRRLGEIGPAAKAAVPVLQGLLEQRNKELLPLMNEALVRIGAE